MVRTRPGSYGVVPYRLAARPAARELATECWSQQSLRFGRNRRRGIVVGVHVGLQGEPHRRVPEHVGDDAGVRSGRNEDRPERVAEIVEPNPG